jgi:hypothetical protein
LEALGFDSLPSECSEYVGGSLGVSDGGGCGITWRMLLLLFVAELL